MDQLIGQVGVPRLAETMRAVDGLAQFRHMMARGIETYFTPLDERQRDLVDMNPATPFLVLGGPGTGKTVIAMHRLVRCASEPTAGPVLSLCFNRPRAQAVGQMAEALANGPLLSHVEIMTMHDWCQLSIVRSGGKIPVPPGNVNGPTPGTLRQLTFRHFGRLTNDQRTALGGRNGRFVHEEISAVIKQSNLTTREAYLGIDRGWRGERLGEGARHAIWSVWEMVQAELGDKGIADWDDLPRLATDALTTSSTSVRPYREIIIDEVQDATRGIIDLCRRQLPGTSTGLFAFADPVQRLYNRLFRANRDAIAPHVTTRRWISKDYRTTQQVWNLAKAWRVADQSRDDVAEAAIDPDRPGPAPKRCIETSSGDALNALLDAVVEAATQVNPGLIEVIYLGDARGTEIRNRLTDRMVASTIIDGRTEMLMGAPTVKLMTMRRLKGLDFQTVFILMPTCPDHSRDPITWQDNALTDEARHVFYVAATRAAHALNIVARDTKPHPFLSALDPFTSVVAGSRGQLWRNRHGGDDAPDGIAPDLPVVDNGA
ncbi:MAG: AAA family ATPase [Chloroflexi bacterium]|nr:AAA family ATPase [Chloroflexota bacterium]